jgi:hypothetical protein
LFPVGFVEAYEPKGVPEYERAFDEHAVLREKFKCFMNAEILQFFF